MFEKQKPHPTPPLVVKCKKITYKQGGIKFVVTCRQIKGQRESDLLGVSVK